MPEEWTGKIVGYLHCKKIGTQELADEIPWSRVYLSHVLNSHRVAPNAERRIWDAIRRIEERRSHEN